MAKKRKICFFLTSRIHYARNKLILRSLRERSDVDLSIVIGASAILKKYGDIGAWLERDGFSATAKVTMSLEGGTNVAMAKTTGLGIIEFASVLENINPDLVVVRGDRYECLAVAVAACYMNKTLAHIEGGDISGNIDESARHSITKLAHFHFVTNEPAKKRIIMMGENPKCVFNFGSPDVELVALNNFPITSQDKDLQKIGVGEKNIDIEKQFLIVIFHPVTSEISKNKEHTLALLNGILRLKMPTFLFWPNIDAGTDEVSNVIRAFREKTDINGFVHFIKDLEPERFLALLRKAACLVGNSSSGIKECSYFGTPVVNIGTRQTGRLKAENVIDVVPKTEDIVKRVQEQIKHGRHQTSKIYYQPDTAKKIAEKLAVLPLYIQKKFYDR